MHTIIVVLFIGIYATIVPAEYLSTYTFPDNFLFGVASSAYQIEGAWNTSDKGANIWDDLTHKRPHLVADGSNGDIACDSYTHAIDDIALIKNLGVAFYRFSLSWSRILPSGFIHRVNPDGIRYYNEVIDALIAQGVTPVITLYHWDLPSTIQELGGWTNDAIVYYFEDYARLAFETFGDRVKTWITINEPVIVCKDGYGEMNKAPALNISGIAEYVCMHNLLKAHAAAYHVYDEEFRSTQKGNISITVDGPWYEPLTDLDADVNAAERMRQFYFGWVANPIFGNGDYPAVVKQFVADRSAKEGFPESRLPEFTQEEMDYIKGTSDFFGVNHYTTNLVEDASDSEFGEPSFRKDTRVTIHMDEEWDNSASDWLKVVPWGLRKLLNWINNSYSVSIHITENGFSDYGELDDKERVVYLQLYLNEILKAIHEDGVDIQAYAFWSLTDNFEWLEGYGARFGLYSVDFDDPARPRTPKLSVEEVRKIVVDRKLPERTYGSEGSITGINTWLVVLGTVTYLLIIPSLY